MKIRKPVITIIILILNILGFLLELMFGEDHITALFGMYQGAIGDGQWYRILTSGFFHYGIQHIGSNMLCLVLFGITYEPQMGSKRFLLISLASLLGAGLTINYYGGNSLHAGASGLIWGLMTSILVLSVKNHENPLNVLKCIAFNLLYTFTNSGISWQGHIGGGIAGFIIALILFRDPMTLNGIPKKKKSRKHDNHPTMIIDRRCKNCGQRLSFTSSKCPVCGCTDIINTNRQV